MEDYYAPGRTSTRGHCQSFSHLKNAMRLQNPIAAVANTGHDHDLHSRGRATRQPLCDLQSWGYSNLIARTIYYLQV